MTLLYLGITGPVIAPYVPCCLKVASKALDLLQLKQGDHVMDLGSGDGRLLQLCHQRYPFVKITGIEYDELLVKYCHEKYPHLNVIQGDLFQVDFSKTTHFILYLLPLGLEKLYKKFKDCIVVTIGYQIPSVQFIESISIEVQDHQMGGSKTSSQHCYKYIF